MAAQSTGATDIAFKGQQRYTISEHHENMYTLLKQKCYHDASQRCK